MPIERPVEKYRVETDVRFKAARQIDWNTHSLDTELKKHRQHSGGGFEEP